MSKIKIILAVVFFVMIVAIASYITHKFDEKYFEARQRTIIEQKMSIIKANTKTVEAHIEYEGELLSVIDSLIYDLENNFKYVYADPPETDSDIAPVDEWIEFTSDWADLLPDVVEEVLKEDTRVATTTYKYRDRANDYAVDLKVLFPYKTQIYSFTPLNVRFESVKTYTFAAGIIWIPEQAVLIGLDYDLSCLRFGASAGLTKEFKPEIALSLGYRF